MTSTTMTQTPNHGTLPVMRTGEPGGLGVALVPCEGQLSCDRHSSLP